MNMKLTKSILRNLIKEELVAVKGGLGSMRLDQIQTDLRRKLEDLLARADAGAYHQYVVNRFRGNPTRSR
jgi:hypothetical protein